jgi:F-box protein 11
MLHKQKISFVLSNFSPYDQSIPTIRGNKTVLHVPSTQFPDISRAIAAAHAGDCVLVEPGTYYEQLVIDKDISVVGSAEEGDLPRVEWFGEGPAVTVRANASVVSLVLRFTGKRKPQNTEDDKSQPKQPIPGQGQNEDLPKRSCIEILSGSVELTNCDIKASGIPVTNGVLINGKDARATVRNCDMHHCTGSGILVSDSAVAVIQDCHLRANVGSGVTVIEKAGVTIRETIIHDGSSRGIVIQNGGACTLVNNDIFGNDGFGIDVSSTATTVRSNCVHDGKGGGILIRQEGNASDPDITHTISENEIFANAGVALEVVGSKAIIYFNRIHDGQSGGILVRDKSTVEVRDNVIFENQAFGIRLKVDSAAELFRNRIYNGRGVGIDVKESSEAQITDNDIFGHSMAGIAVREYASAFIHNNRIHNAEGGGIRVFRGGIVDVDGNNIFQNGTAGVAISNGGGGSIRRNRIHHGMSVGVFIMDDGKALISHNRLFENAGAEIAISKGGSGEVLHNTIREGKGSGVYIGADGNATIEGNRIFRNTMPGILITHQTKCTVRGNVIVDGLDDGIRIHSNSICTIEGNDLRGNMGKPLSIEGESTTVVARDNQS